MKRLRSNFSYRAAQGFAIITAIFILVVLAVLGAFMVNVSTNQHIGSALDVQGVRAYQAARAGIEWGLYQKLINPPSSCVSVPPSSFSPTATTLAGFKVTVTCIATPGGNGGPIVYTITSTACNDVGGCPSASPNSLYVERRLDVTF